MSDRKPAVNVALESGRGSKIFGFERLLYPKDEAAYLLGISVRSLDYLVAEGRIKNRRVGGRILFTRTDLERFSREDDPARIRSA